MQNIDIIKKGEELHKLNYEELYSIISSSDADQELFKAADRVRKKYVGDEVHLRGLIEFSNICANNCLYCGIRALNRDVKRYKLSKEEILSLARSAKKYGYMTLVMQSGECSVYEDDEFCEILSEIKSMDFAITLSIGEKSPEQYAMYKKAGADRFLLRIETTDPELYQKMHPNMSLENRMASLRYLKAAGYETGTGNLVGLPGQTDSSIAKDILFFSELGADMIGLGPFIPSPGTPLALSKGGTFIKALKVMALTRLLIPDANIPATTAMETLQPSGRMIALASGANVIMPNVTDESHKVEYNLYPGKPALHESALKCRDDICKKLLGIGRPVSKDYGFRKRGFR